METTKILSHLPDALLPWYHTHKRELPWRTDKEPYHIWLSEIMLQQTRVEAVKGYYTRFLQALPTIESLAQADDELLHKLWEGLGYYSRVRNLKRAANVIMEIHGGRFPETYSDIIALPGIGTYTAGAISSIVFNQKTPAVDGNVLRVISRITNDPTPIDLPATKKCVQETLKKVYPDNAGDFTQALMELGATVCGPNGAPACDNCPCKAFCRGYQLGTAEALPDKSPKKARRKELLTVLVLRCDGRYAIQKRANKGLLAGLWQFPNIKGKYSTEEIIGKVEQLCVKPRELLRQVEKKHVFTHVEWEMNGVYMDVAEPLDDFVWLLPEEINERIALPTAFRQFWEEIDYV